MPAEPGLVSDALLTIVVKKIQALRFETQTDALPFLYAFVATLFDNDPFASIGDQISKRYAAKALYEVDSQGITVWIDRQMLRSQTDSDMLAHMTSRKIGCQDLL